MRTQKGEYSTFDAPGAEGGGTLPISNSSSGAIAGFFWDALGANHGFMRSADGHFTKIDVPSASGGIVLSTFAYGINAPGDVTGVYVDANHVPHGFLFTNHGNRCGHNGDGDNDDHDRDNDGDHGHQNGDGHDNDDHDGGGDHDRGDNHDH